MNLKPLLGHKALITGGSKGIGGGIANKLADLGCHVTIIARNIETLQFKINQLNKEFPNVDEHKYISFDLGSPHLIEDTLKRELDFKSISILVNCAGQSQKKLLMQTPIDEIQQITNVNFISPVVLCKFFSKAMARNQHLNTPRHIVNISSIASDYENHHLVGASIYCSTKAALRKFSQVLQDELGMGKRTQGIKVHCLNPGLVKETDIGQNVAHDANFKTFSVSQIAENVAQAVLKKC